MIQQVWLSFTVFLLVGQLGGGLVGGLGLVWVGGVHILPYKHSSGPPLLPSLLLTVFLPSSKLFIFADYAFKNLPATTATACHHPAATRVTNSHFCRVVAALGHNGI